jgi:hypothetical protein
VDEVLQEREPGRRAVVAVGVVALVVAGLAVARLATGRGETPSAAPSPTSSAPAAADVSFSASGESATGVDHGEYTYAASLRSVSAVAVRVLRVVPLAADGAEIPAVAGVALPEVSHTTALNLRSYAAEPGGHLVPAYRSFLAVVRVKPGCSSADPRLAGLRVVARVGDGREVSYDVTSLDLDAGEAETLRAAACGGAPGPGVDFLAVAGGGGSAYVSDDMHAYETYFRSAWPTLVTVVEVVPVDAAGRPVPVALATALLDGVGEEKYDLRLRPAPLALRPQQRALLLVRMRTTCDPPRAVAAYHVVAEVEGERVTQELPVNPRYVPGCGQP